jgi:hypothetical protein
MTLLVTWSENCPDCQIVSVLAETEKAMQIKNADTGRTAWIPKSGLIQYHAPKICSRPDDPREKIVAPWFRRRCDMRQMAALGYAGN